MLVAVNEFKAATESEILSWIQSRYSQIEISSSEVEALCRILAQRDYELCIVDDSLCTAQLDTRLQGYVLEQQILAIMLDQLCDTTSCFSSPESNDFEILCKLNERIPFISLGDV